MRPKPVSKIVVKVDPRYTQAVQNYEAGVKAMQLQKFERAKAAFEKVLEGPSNELADRARMNLNICKQSLAKFTTHFKTTEEHYDYAIALMNSGDYDGARSHLDKLVKQHPNADYAHYGLGVALQKTKQYDEAVKEFRAALDLNGDMFRALYNLGMTYKMMDDKKNAKEWLKRFTTTAGSRGGADLMKAAQDALYQLDAP